MHFIHKPLFVAVAISLPTLALAQSSTAIGQITVEGQSSIPGAGLMIQEDSPKARSTVTRERLDEQRATSNPYQSLALLPAVNAFASDATGLFGGTLNMRGFSASQIGFTIDGAPVNDSGNFEVYPQEYVDAENLTEMFVTQGATDTESPHVGATGGNIGIVSGNPRDAFGVRVAQTLGDKSLTRSFVRVDTGKFGNDGTTAFVSYSKSMVDKWRGLGEADRDHVDAKILSKLSPGSQLSAGIAYNYAVNNFFKNQTLAQYQANGRYFDYATTFPGRLTPGAGAQNESTAVGGVSRADYYALAVNPFENYIATFKANLKLNDKMRLDIEPYYWYGYGNGSFGASLAENNTALRTLNGGVNRDLNGDGDTSDTVLFYRSSVTKTQRPGVTTKLNWNIDNHKLMFGYWYERANHRQTQPFISVNADGTSADVWAENNLATLSSGAVLQGRDWKTISTAQQFFVQDTIGLMNDRLSLMLGVRTPKIERDFTNNPSLGNTTGTTIRKTVDYSKTLGNIGAKYQLDPQSHLFANVANSFRTPSNFVLSDLVRTEDARPETATNYDFGYRYQVDRLSLAATAFMIDFKDRFASVRDPDGTTRTYNAGNVKSKGFELELGAALTSALSSYVSLSYLDSKLTTDFATRNSSNQLITLPTNGKQFVDAPRWMAGLGLQYKTGGWTLGATAKYTDKRYSTLMNDEMIPAFTTVDVNAAYRFASTALVKNPTLRANISNLLDANKLAIVNSTQINATAVTSGGVTIAGAAPQYTPLAPRFASITLSADF